MLRQLLPRGLKGWLRRLLGREARPLPVAALQYLPHRHGQASYHLPRTPAESPRCPAGLPIPPVELWMGYGGTPEIYLDSGRQDVARLLDLVGGTGFRLGEGQRVVELGCAAGRMLRHFAPWAGTTECWGVDIHGDCIAWAKQHLAPPFHFATTTLMPHLPFEDRSCDLIYAGSVFTHIDDLADAWLLELRRLSRPGGRVVLTIHDEATLRLLDTTYRDHWLAQAMARVPEYQAARGDLGMLVVGRGADSQVFYGRDFFLKMLRPLFEVCAVAEEAYEYQTALVLTRTKS